MDFRTKITQVDDQTYLLEPELEKSALGYRFAFNSFQSRGVETFASGLGRAE